MSQAMNHTILELSTEELEAVVGGAREKISDSEIVNTKFEINKGGKLILSNDKLKDVSFDLDGGKLVIKGTTTLDHVVFT